jgi:cellobiose phosphorylase
VDWLLTGYPEYCDYTSSLSSEYRGHILICYNKSSERTHDFFNGFIASDAEPAGFDSSRREFMGYGQVDRPRAVAEGACRNSLGVCENLVGALQHNFDLEPGGTARVNILIGAASGYDNAAGVAGRLFAPGAIEAEFKAVAGRIRQSYGRVSFDIPEPKIAHLFNHWIKRSIELHTEVGTDTGKGFRDILQAAWAISGFDPPGAKSKIAECLAHQYADGHTLRGWNPVDDHYYSDGPVWIAPAVDAYLRETHDFDFLSQQVSYFDGGTGSIWEHTLRALRGASGDLGPHGLIRAHYGDWNDSLNMIGTGGRGESVWTTIGVIFSLKRAADIAENALRDKVTASELKDRALSLARTVNTAGWDGGWYLAAINDAGQKVGSHEETEGRIYANPQTWAVLAGITSPERLKLVLKVIDEDLESDYGTLTLTPAYKTPNPGIGRLSWFVPGMWENASAYCHGSAFKILADTYLKRGDKAYGTLVKILPDSELNPSSHSGVPPYMLTNMYYGPENPRKGQILYSWITGTADWLYNAMNSYIMGVRATYGGLLIDPCVPSHWHEFGLTRYFMGAQYHVNFHNPDGKQSGVSSITLDGRHVDGCVLPAGEGGSAHIVDIIM